MEMSEMDQNGNRRGLASIRLVMDDLRIPIENVISAYQKREWKAIYAKDMSEFACHPCAILSDGVFSVFVKYGEDPISSTQFYVELDGLRFLSEKAGIIIPTAIGIVPVEKGALLIFERIEEIEKRSTHWAQIGKILARIHRIKADYFGFPANGFIGPFHQDNTPTLKWHTFFSERRFWPHLQLAITSGNLPSYIASDVERIIPRLPELCGPEVQPSLLHGDAQQNNFIASQEATYTIDPAVYFGHPEIDLALVDCWQPAPESFLQSYKEEMPLNSDFTERRDLWRIPHYLAGVALEGPCHLKRLTTAVNKYL
jgi:protein-ribulosamine 3-kinase